MDQLRFRLPLDSWWRSPRWREYERVCGIRPEESRARVLNDATWQTRIVDLGADLHVLHAGLRKSYRQTIRDAEIVFRPERIRGDEAIRQCRILHARAARRVTRPIESWHMMAEWELTGDLVVIGARDRATEDLVGFAAFERRGRWAYYGHEAAIVRDVAHVMVWAAMQELKAIGVDRLELGWQGQATDEKGKAIEFFRRGFGGTDVPAHAGEGIGE